MARDNARFPACRQYDSIAQMESRLLSCLLPSSCGALVRSFDGGLRDHAGDLYLTSLDGTLHEENIKSAMRMVDDVSETSCTDVIQGTYIVRQAQAG
jgi:hypothetical protein